MLKDILSEAKENGTPAKCRQVGYLLGALLLVVAVRHYFKQAELSESTLVLGAFGSLLVLFGAIAPAALRPLTLAWFGLAAVLHRIISPVVLFIMFFVIITPIALLKRLTGSARDSRASAPGTAVEKRSYWIVRSPAGPDPKSLFQQF